MSDRPLILAADDDPDILTLIRLALERAGCEVITAPDGQAALELAAERPPSMAVLDLSMPRASGLEVTERLRATAATATIPIVILSAAVQPSDITAAHAAGADAHIKKPFSPRDLRTRVQELLDARGDQSSPPAAE
jgi:CheY-like chemotaxis protein